MYIKVGVNLATKFLLLSKPLGQSLKNFNLKNWYPLRLEGILEGNIPNSDPNNRTIIQLIPIT